LQLEAPLPCPSGSLVIASKLDADINANNCRLAFYGHANFLITAKDYEKTLLPSVKIYKVKVRTGTIDRVADDNTIIGKDLFKKETRIDLFVGLKVQLSTGEWGTIESPFGQSGKFKAYFPGGLGEQVRALAVKGKEQGKGKDQRPPAAEEQTEPQGEDDRGKRVQVILTFKKYIFDDQKKIVQ